MVSSMIGLGLIGCHVCGIIIRLLRDLVEELVGWRLCLVLVVHGCWLEIVALEIGEGAMRRKNVDYDL